MELVKEKTHKTIGERSIYTTQLLSLLRKCEIGQTVTYDEMDNVIGMKTQAQYDGYPYQKKARDILERDDNIVFEVITKIGLKRLAPKDVGKSSLRIYLNQKKSILKKNKRRLKTIDDEYENLSLDVRTAIDLTRTILAYDAVTIKPKKIELIEQAVSLNQKMLGFSDTLKLFEK